MDFEYLASYIFFLFSSVSIGGYFFLRLRQFDLLTIYFLSMVLYSFPLFFGYTYSPNLKEYESPVYLTYIVAGIAFIGCYFGIFLKVLFSKVGFCSSLSFLNVDRYFNWLLFLFCGALSLFLIPGLFLAQNKNEMLNSGGFLLMLLSAMVPVGLINSYRSGYRMFSVFFFVLGLLLFLFGSRSVLVFIFLSLLLIVLSDAPMILLKKYYVGLGCLFFLLLVVIGKTFYGSFMAGGISGVSTWFYEFEFTKLWHGAEFLATGGILEEVIKTGFQIPIWTVPMSLLSFLPIPTSWLGFSSSIFNELFQPALFPDIDYGMAYSPWAEAYSWLGLCGVVLYAFFIPALIAVLDKLWVSNKKNAVGSIFLVMGVTVSFWIHRNSIGSELAYLRNIFFPGFFMLSFSMLLSFLFVHKR